MLDKNVKYIINGFNQVYLLPQYLLFGFNTISKPKLQYQLSATTIPLSLLLTNQDKLSYTLLPEIGYNIES
jgi:hypothetical protein